MSVDPMERFTPLPGGGVYERREIHEPDLAPPSFHALLKDWWERVHRRDQGRAAFKSQE